jgi:hypothetical protein
VESFEVEYFTSNWGVLIANKLQCHNLYESQKDSLQSWFLMK